VRTALLVAVGVIAAGLGLAGSSSHVLRRPELVTVDARFDVRGEQPERPDVVVIGIGAQSLHDLDARHPIPRLFQARMIDTLRRAGAKVIAYDLQFTGPTDAKNDNALIRAIDRTPGVILATDRVNDRGEDDILGDGAKEHGAIAGNSILPTRGGVFRRLPYEDIGLRTFSVAAAEQALGYPLDRARFAGDGAWIDFRRQREFEFSDVLRGKVEPDDFRGKIVVVGATSPIAQDIHATPTSAAMPGPVIQANEIATFLDGFPLRDPAGWLALLLIAGMGLVTPLTAIPLRGLRWLPIPLALSLVYLVIAQLAFNGGTILPVAAPLTALIVGALGTLAVAYGTDLRERRRLRAAFGRFVPPEIVDQLVGQGAGERLAGTELEATVLFCDLRGFTTVAEDLAAPEVIALLNRYLTEMSDAILDHGGTVVSYMGDGIMAVFGAPVAHADHADRALAAAREMLEQRLPAFNAAARRELRMGIGLCSGPVMSGNVGSDRRLEYTAVGDTTNTASRLEGMTKDAGVPVLIAETTKAALRDGEGGLRFVGELEVRGRDATVRAWTLA
jgi:adenylate cyclase